MYRKNTKAEYCIAQIGKETFFGYYDLCPWSKGEDRILFGRTDRLDRHPIGDKVLCLGVFDLSTQNETQFATSNAWNWQQGCRLQWHPTLEDTVIYNDLRKGRLVSIIKNVLTGDELQIDFPYYSLHPNGEEAVSLNFSRLAKFRPGYGYPGSPNNICPELPPALDGVYLLDINKNDLALSFSLERLGEIGKCPPRNDAITWVNHLEYSPTGEHFVFLHRWRYPGEDWFDTRMFVSDRFGRDIHCVAEGYRISHFTWKDANTLIAWLYHPEGHGFYEIDRELGPKRKIEHRDLSCNGHCNVFHGSEWLVTDTYPEGLNRIRKLILYNWHSDFCVHLLELHVPAPCQHELRCDFHARWSRSGNKLCFDSAHEGTRRMYIIDVSSSISV